MLPFLICCAIQTVHPTLCQQFCSLKEKTNKSNNRPLTCKHCAVFYKHESENIPVDIAQFTGYNSMHSNHMLSQLASDVLFACSPLHTEVRGHVCCGGWGGNGNDDDDSFSAWSASAVSRVNISDAIQALTHLDKLVISHVGRSSTRTF